MDPLLVIKASLFLSATLGAAWLLRRAPAAARHGLWTVGFAAILLLPIASVMLPSLDVPVPSSWQAILPAPASPARTPVAPSSAPAERIDITRSALAAESVPAAPSGPLAEGPASDRHVPSALSVRQWLWGAWLAGVLAAASTILLALWRTEHLARTAETLTEQAWQQAATDIGRRLDLRRPATLLVSAEIQTPMAGGLWRPVVYLPTDARHWAADRRDVVLAHELAHAAGRDPLRHFVTRLALSVYWFHPLAWLGARQAAMAREQACDEAVLALGTRRSDYARVLLEMAESLSPVTRPLGALPMAQRSLLEKRLMTILDPGARSTPRPALLWPAIGVALFTLSVAVARPSAIAEVVAVIAPVAATPAVVATNAVPAVPSVEPALPTTPVAQTQPVIARDSACGWETRSRSSFSGGISYSSNTTSTTSGGTRLYEQIGIRNGDRIIQKGFGSLQLCMVAEGLGDRTSNERPSEWIGRARRVVLESRDGRDVQHMEIASGAATPRVWQVNGADRGFDTAAGDWRDRLIEVLDETWRIAMLRGEVSTLRGEISTMFGRRSTLLGEISTLTGEVSTMRGRQSTIRGELSTLQGQISTINGRVSTLQGAISSEQGAMSSLMGRLYDGDAAERARINARLASHADEIARIERQIVDYDATAKVADVMREIARLDVDGKVAAIDAQIRAFDLDGKIAEIEGRIRALDVDGEVARLERRIDALDADRRVKEMEPRRDAALTRLQAAIKAIAR
jgi:beta-lactamase regulating signal transducer with metallopeptidase domain